MKIWSLLKHENLTTGKKNIVEKRRNCSFSSFPQYFQYISNFKSPVTHIFVKCGCFPQFCKSDMSRYGYLEVFQRVLWNCISSVCIGVLYLNSESTRSLTKNGQYKEHRLRTVSMKNLLDMRGDFLNVHLSPSIGGTFQQLIIPSMISCARVSHPLPNPCL